MNATNYPYDLTNISQVNSTVDFITEVNHLTGDYFMAGVLFVAFIVMFMSLLRFGAREAIIVSLLVSTMASIVFLIFGWVSLPIVILFVVALALSLAFLFSSERN